MVSDEIGSVLHDRYTLGDRLTVEEEGLLEAWYAEKDGAESRVLESARRVSLPSLSMLQMQLDAALEQLALVIQRLQQITQENDVLRQEIAELKLLVVVPESA